LLRVPGRTYTVRKGFGLTPGAALTGVLRLEMIVDNVGGHHLQESKDGIGMLAPKGAQQATVVVAQFEIGVLDEIVEELTRGSHQRRAVLKTAAAITG